MNFIISIILVSGKTGEVQITAYYKSIGMTLFDVLEKIYREYGYYSDSLESLAHTSKNGQEKIKNLFERFRYNKNC